MDLLMRATSVTKNTNKIMGPKTLTKIVTYLCGVTNMYYI